MSPQPEDLVLTTLDVHATEDPEAARVAAYGDAWSRGFHEGALGDQQRTWWLEHSRADDVTLRAAYPASSLVEAPPPVGTCTSWDQEINVGGGALLPLHMITDVTVAPTHRRRGLLRRLLTDDLADAAARGVPLAAVTVSEGAIYGRFGFGVATRRRAVEVAVASGRFALRNPRDEGSVQLLEPAQARPHVERVFACHLATTRGEVARPAYYAMVEDGWDWESGGRSRKAMTALHLDAAGTVDGCVRFEHKDEDQGTIVVRSLIALTDAARLRLWRFLAETDLVAKVKASVAVDDALDLALVDPRAVTTTALTDLLWLRILDPVRALEARPWREDGSVVLDVDDPLGHAAGRFRLTTDGGRSRVERTDDVAGVHLDAATLAALYLGDRPVAAHAAAGHVGGAQVEAFASMADHAGPTPYCSTGF